MATLKKRSDGRYARQVTVGTKDGKPTKKTVYGKTIKEVNENYNKLINLINTGVSLDYSKSGLSDVLDEWYNLRIFPNVNPNTQKRYKYFMISFKKYLGEMKLTDVKKYHIENMFVDIKANGNASAHDYFMLTKKFFNYAVDNDLIYKNPCNGMSMQYTPKQKRLLTKDELEKIDKCDLTRKDKAYLYLLRYTGMRNGESLALCKSDIDRADMTISINKTVVSASRDVHVQNRAKTEAGNRIMPIFLPLAKTLFDYIDHLPEDQDRLFLSNVGKLYSVTAAGHLFKRILKDCHIKDSEITPHYLRHNFISECYKAGIDIKKVQTWVGHADIQTTLNIYTHLEKDVVKDGSDMDYFYAPIKAVANGSQTEVNSKFRVVK